eukprot:366250-Heterocapsa_arctica.AAC.1
MVGGSHGAVITSGERNEDTYQIYLRVEAQTNQHIVDKNHERDNIVHNNNNSEEDLYPGVSSKRSVILRAEQFFHEGKAEKAINNQKALRTNSAKRRKHNK